MKIYIIRHGETDLNVKGVMQGWLDEPLNQCGRDLAEVTGRAMKDVHFDCCISSPLVRAKETVEIVLRESGNEIPVLTDDRIKEIYFGDLEGKHLSALGDEGEIFHDDPFHFKGFPNGERVQDVCRRTQEFLKELIARDDDKTYLIGIHGCALRAMLNFLYEDPSNYWHGRVPYNCAVNIIEAKDGVARLVEDDKIYYSPDLAVDRYAKMKKKSILFFDVDGTLVDEEEHRIPESTLEALQRAREKGHLLFVNSGRCKSFLPEALKAFDFDGFCYACGAYIEYHGDALMEEFVPAGDLDYIRDVIKEYKMYGIFQGPEYCWFSQDVEVYDSMEKFLEIAGKDYHGPRKSLDEDTSEMRVNKLVCFGELGKDYSEFQRKLEERYQVFKLAPAFYEIIPLPYTKASCMDYLMEYFEIDRKDCYAFGDSPNDLSMLKNVPNSICMGNGYEEVKKEASYVTSDIKEDGILNALEHFKLI